MRLVMAFGAGIAGAILGYVLAAGATLAIGELVGASNFEGALGMQAAFGTGPVGGIVGLLLGIWLALRRGTRAGHSGQVRGFLLVIAAIAVTAAGGLWYAYDTRPLLATSSSGTPRLDFEIRLPPGVDMPTPASNMRVTLNTEKNRMPAQLLDGDKRAEGGRLVVPGTVELYYRSGWRLLEVIPAGDAPAQIFDLKLAARPSHMSTFGPWRRVDFVAVGDQQPRAATAADTYELRSRVVYRDAELKETGH